MQREGEAPFGMPVTRWVVVIGVHTGPWESYVYCCNGIELCACIMTCCGRSATTRLFGQTKMEDKEPYCLFKLLRGLFLGEVWRGHQANPPKKHDLIVRKDKDKKRDPPPPLSAKPITLATCDSKEAIPSPHCSRVTSIPNTQPAIFSRSHACVPSDLGIG